MPDPGAPPRPPLLVLAFDFGLRRIGIARGNTVSGTASPLAVLPAVAGQPDWSVVQGLVRDQGAQQLVVGRPYNADGSTHALSGPSDQFAAELHARCQIPVDRVDERYSSLEAEASLRAARQSGARRRAVERGDIDSQAAATILSRWLAGER
jgi:putative Holliday junction resolvase